MALEDRAKQREQVEAAMATLLAAHDDVGGDIVSAGGTGTYDIHATTGVTEVQAGSYALMDTAYAKLGLPVPPGGLRRRHRHRRAPRPRRRRRRPEGARHGPRQPVDRRRPRLVLQRRARHVRARRRAARPSATASASCRPTSTRRWRCTRWRGSSTATRCSTAGRSTSAAGDDARRRQGAAWLAVAGMAVTAVAPWVTPVRNRVVAATRSLMPWSALSAVPLAVGAALTGRRRLAVAAGAVGAAGVAMAAPMVVPRRQAAPDPTRRPAAHHAQQPAVHQPPGGGGARRPRHARRRRPHVQRAHPDATCAGSTTRTSPARYPHRVELAAGARQRHRAVEPPPADRPTRSRPTATTPSSPTSTPPAGRCGSS